MGDSRFARETHALLVVCRAAAVSSSWVAQWPSHRAPSVGTQLAACVLMIKSSHRPMGKCLVDSCPFRFSSFMMGAASNYSIMYVLSAPETSKVPIAPMGRLLTCLPRLTLAQLRTLGQLQTVRATETLQMSHRPLGKCLIDITISILFVYDGCCLELPVCSTCYLRLKLQKFPSPRWEDC